MIGPYGASGHSTSAAIISPRNAAPGPPQRRTPPARPPARRSPPTKDPSAGTTLRANVPDLISQTSETIPSGTASAAATTTSRVFQASGLSTTCASSPADRTLSITPSSPRVARARQAGDRETGTMQGRASKRGGPRAARCRSPGPARPHSAPQLVAFTQNDHRGAQRRTTVVAVLRPHSLRSSSATPAHHAPRAASRDQVRGVGGPDPASQLLAPPAYRSRLQLWAAL